jgi:hypothetical protein
VSLIAVHGEKIDPEALVGRRAKEIAAYLKAEHSPFLSLLECRRKGDIEVLVVEFDLEVAPRRPVKIERKEQLFLICGEGSEMPLVVPAREGFPIEQLHVTIHEGSEFASLCLWDTPLEDLKARFTPFMFLARTKEWLELAAEEKLHQHGQGVEPVLTGTRVQAILPAGKIKPEVRYIADGREGLDKRLTIRFAEPEKSAGGNAGDTRFVLVPVTTQVVCGRAVRSAPHTFEQLASLLAEHGCNLTQTITDFVTQVQKDPELEKALPVMLVTFPKALVVGGRVEGEDVWAFGIVQTVGELGASLGTYGSAGGFRAPLIGAKVSGELPPTIPIEPMLVVRELDGSQLTTLSGMEGGEDLKCFAVGAGALGSKVLEVCVRGGFGRWWVLDKDMFLPHNAVRHLLGEWAIGQPKAHYVGNFLNQVVPGERVLQSFVEDITDPRGLSAEASAALQGSSLVVDMSASVAVSRTLARMEGIPRSVSLFFNPSGTDLAVLLQDSKRSLSLLDLEASYYAALIKDERLAGHLDDGSGAAVRYGNGCRDVTARISPEKVAQLGGLAAQGLRRYSALPDAAAAIWRTQPTGETTLVELQNDVFRGDPEGEWDIRWSVGVLETLAAERQADLPNETGGILLALVDFERKLIRISAAIEAPPDSVKKPHYFERGRTGLERRLKEIGARTAGQLRYVGEWHSHPVGVPARPSADDNQLFGKLAELFRGTGEPHIMGIVGDDEFFWRLGIDNQVVESALSLKQ